MTTTLPFTLEPSATYVAVKAVAAFAVVGEKAICVSRPSRPSVKVVVAAFAVIVHSAVLLSFPRITRRDHSVTSRIHDSMSARDARTPGKLLIRVPKF